jgi:hypothetical protein
MQKARFSRASAAVAAGISMASACMWFGARVPATAQEIGRLAGSRGPLVSDRPRKRTHGLGLGPVVTSADGGQIFGWAIDEHGTGGVLAEAIMGFSAVETFDQTTGKITKIVAKQQSRTKDHELVVAGIVAGDVGLIDDERVIGDGRDDRFDLMDPVTGGKFTGRWNPPNPFDLLIESIADQQTDPSVAIMVDRDNPRGATPEVLLSDVAKHKVQRSMLFPSGQIWYGPQIVAQDTHLQQAVVGAQSFASNKSDFVVFDLKTGNATTFDSVNGWGAFQGIAIDSTTDVMCTATSADFSVQFYNLNTQQGITETLPGAGGELQSGAAIAADPVNHLFLVSQPNSSVSPSGGSTIFVYGEDGTLLETLNGFSFSNVASAILEHIQVNGAQRTGFVNGPSDNQLQSFTY